MIRMLIALAGLGFVSAQAATFTPTRFDDPTPDGCAVSDCSLREAVIDADQTAASDTIVLAPGTYAITLSGNDTSEEVGDLDITSDLVIQGQPGVVIDGQDQGRILDIRNDANVTIENLRITNANTSLMTNGSLNGGALQINGGSLTLRGVEFVSNSAQTLGGAVYLNNGANALIEDSAFAENQGANGAAIISSSGSTPATLTVRNTLFVDNQATQRGSAANLTGNQTDATFEEVTFLRNSSQTGGGALLFLARDLVLDGVVAAQNTAIAADGGFLLMTGTSHAKTISIRNAILRENAAVNGGAIDFTDADDVLTMAHVALLDNMASSDGGALFFNGGTVQIDNSTFSGNSGDDGGAVRAIFDGDMTLRHVTISGNTAASGTALSVLGSQSLTLTIGNSILDGDCATTGSQDSIVSAGGNLEGPGDTCMLVDASDLVGASASQLGLTPLRENAGATPTIELTPDSEARGRGVTTICNALTVDQLFQARDGVCNAGSVESNTLFIDSFETIRSLGSSVVIAL
ncbi:MAG: right-handed parallel beta-helix repeat-containing protein [Xanthomonadales bacterium]|nr:right-handed parallel beta-helix repeat-containing protein [Xanthomonadales bacterium]